MQTLPNDINLQSLIIGFYGDAAGNVHGFTRHPDGHFQNFDFPGADITFAWKVNDLGQLAGQYTTNFPGHGFVLTNAGDDDGRMSASNYFSFDYPDSQGTAARGINNDGRRRANVSLELLLVRLSRFARNCCTGASTTTAKSLGSIAFGAVRPDTDSSLRESGTTKSVNPETNECNATFLRYLLGGAQRCSPTFKAWMRGFGEGNHFPADSLASC